MLFAAARLSRPGVAIGRAGAVLAAPFSGLWYLLGMLIPAALSAAIGPRLLRWEAAASEAGCVQYSPDVPAD